MRSFWAKAAYRGDEMLNKTTEKSFRYILRSKTTWKSYRIKFLAAACLLLFIGCALWAQGGKEYIYLDGKLIASDAAPLNSSTLCLEYDTTHGFAGIDTAIVHVCNGASLTIGIQYQFVSWGDYTVTYHDDGVIGPMDANGETPLVLPQDAAPGIITVTAVRNMSGGDWVPLSQPYPQYTVRPPKPVANTYMLPDVLFLPADAGTQLLHSANMKYQYITVSMNQPQPAGYAEYTLPLDDSPDYIGYNFLDNGGSWFAGAIPCNVLWGVYTFLATRNGLDSNADAWVNWGDLSPWDPPHITQTVTPSCFCN
jgi:hypothetical protein